MYGPRFIRDFGESVPDVWRSAINSLNESELRRGLKRLTSSGSGSSPTLPQFVKACKLIGEEDGPSRPQNFTQPALTHSCDSFDKLGNACLMRYSLNWPGDLGDMDAAELFRVKTKIAQQFREIASECEVDADEMRSAFKSAFDKHMARKAA